MKLKMASLMRTIITRKKSLVTISTAVENIRRNMDYWEEIRNLTTSQKTTLSPRQKSLLELFMYMELVEGIFSEVVQTIVFTLVENGHDIYDPIRMKFTGNYEEFYEIPLFVKLQFLEKHGFDNIAGSVDRKLRNCIAHLGFIVNEDGSILDRETRKPVTNITGKTDYLGCVCAVTIISLGESLKLG